MIEYGIFEIQRYENSTVFLVTNALEGRSVRLNSIKEVLEYISSDLNSVEELTQGT